MHENHIIQHPGCQSPGSGVLADGGDKHVRRYGLAAELVHFRPEGFDLLGYLFLLVLIPTGHFGEAVIEELAGNIVLIDTLSNAVKFSHSGGTIYIEAVQRSGAIEVSVRDEGVGMTEDALKHIFDKFYQADTAHSSAGNGLGLPLVQRIVQLSCGNIHVSSQLGLGTTFTVTLPIAQKAAISS